MRQNHSVVILYVSSLLDTIVTALIDYQLTVASELALLLAISGVRKASSLVPQTYSIPSMSTLNYTLSCSEYFSR